MPLPCPHPHPHGLWVPWWLLGCRSACITPLPDTGWQDRTWCGGPCSLDRWAWGQVLGIITKSRQPSCANMPSRALSSPESVTCELLSDSFGPWWSLWPSSLRLSGPCHNRSWWHGSSSSIPVTSWVIPCVKAVSISSMIAMHCSGSDVINKFRVLLLSPLLEREMMYMSSPSSLARQWMIEVFPELGAPYRR